MGNLNLHPVYKDGGDDAFYDAGAKWWRGWAGQERDIQERAMIVLTALYILCVRSEKALQYFSSNSNVLLDSFEAWAEFYKRVCLHDTPMYGLKVHPRRKRNFRSTYNSPRLVRYEVWPHRMPDGACRAS